MSQSSDNAKLIRFLQKNALIENSNKPLLFENNYIQKFVFCHLKHRQQKLVNFDFSCKWSEIPACSGKVASALYEKVHLDWFQS